MPTATSSPAAGRSTGSASGSARRSTDVRHAEQRQERGRVGQRERRDDARARDEHRREADGHDGGDEQQQAELAIAARAQADGAHGSVCSSCATSERADSLERREWSKSCRRRVAGSVAAGMRLRCTSENSFTPPPRSYGHALVDRHLAGRRIDADEVRPAQADQRGPEHAQHQRDDRGEHAEPARAAATTHGRPAAEAGHDRRHGDERLAACGSGAGTGRGRAARSAAALRLRPAAPARLRSRQGAVSAAGSRSGSTAAIAAVGRRRSCRGRSDAPAPAVGLQAERDGRDVVLAAGGVGRVHEGAHGRVEVLVLLERARDGALVDEPAQPVGAEQDDVAGARRRRPDVDVDLPVGAERARDHRALRMLRRLLGRQRAGAHPLGDQRVIVRERASARRRATR